jgi:hypothetical protein
MLARVALWERERDWELLSVRPNLSIEDRTLQGKSDLRVIALPVSLQPPVDPI